MEKLKLWAERFDAMSIRERALILVTALVAVSFPVFMYVIEPAQKEHRTLQGQIQRLTATNAEAKVEYQLAKALKVVDPNIELQQQIERLQQQLVEQANLLQQRSAVLVSPNEMVALLQTVLQGYQGVRLVSVSKRAPISISQQDDSAVAAAGLYRHDLELVIEGSFFQVQGFLKAVEKTGKSLFWNSIDYQVESYPKAQVRLELYTLSATQEWLGV
jgi:MSHA biogenesis protein MshJ